MHLVNCENMLGEFKFEEVSEFLKEWMDKGEVCVILCKPNSDRDVIVYRDPKAISPKSKSKACIGYLHENTKPESRLGVNGFRCERCGEIFVKS